MNAKIVLPFLDTLARDGTAGDLRYNRSNQRGHNLLQLCVAHDPLLSVWIKPSAFYAFQLACVLVAEIELLTVVVGAPK